LIPGTILRATWRVTAKRVLAWLLVFGFVLLPHLAGAADGTWRELSPPVRVGAAAIYDPPRDRVVVYGGRDDVGSGLARDRTDTWLLDADGSGPFVLVPNDGPAPPGSPEGRFLRDPLRDRLLFVTGNPAPLPQQVWQLTIGTTAQWTSLTSVAAGPTLRTGSSIVLDPVGDRLLFFGGRGPHPTLGTVSWNDVWQVTLGATPTWSLVATAGTPPPITTNAPAVYDSSRHRMLVLVGTSLWALSLGGTPTWSEQPLSGLPEVGEIPTVLLDAAGDRIVIYTRDVDGFDNSGEVGVVPLAGSTYQMLGFYNPRIRTSNTVVFDPLRSRLLALFAGNPADDTWIFPLAGPHAWTLLGPPLVGPSGTRWIVRDPTTPRFLIPQAGIQHAIGSEDGWLPYVMSGPTPPWSTLVPAGADRQRGEIVAAAPNGLWILEPATGTWTARVSTNTWSGFVPKSAAIDSLGDRVIVLGVSRDSVFQVDVLATWAIPLGVASPTWTRLVPQGDPVAALPTGVPGPVLFADPRRNRMIVIGDFRRGYELSLAGATAWSRLPDFPVNLLNPGLAHDVANDRLFLWWNGLGIMPRTFLLWRLAHSPGSSMLVVEDGTPPASLGPGAFDTATNRLLMTAGAAGVWEFLASPVPPPLPASVNVVCPAVATWTPGGSSPRVVTASVANSAAAAVEYSVSSERAWPGFPLSGVAPVVVGSAAITIPIAVPDSVSAGENRFTVIVRPSGEVLTDSCTFVLRSAGTPTDPTLVLVTPNPSSGVVGFALSLAHETTVRVEIRGLATGRLAFRREFGRLPAGDYALDLVPAGTLRPGVYAVRFFLDGFIRQSKLVVLQ
jgi:hypothetical protein